MNAALHVTAAHVARAERIVAAHLHDLVLAEQRRARLIAGVLFALQIQSAIDRGAV